jgi:hypothetical protein
MFVVALRTLTSLHVETALAGLGGDVGVFDTGDRCCRWAFVQVLNELLDCVVAALRLALNLRAVSNKTKMGSRGPYSAV